MEVHCEMWERIGEVDGAGVSEICCWLSWAGSGLSERSMSALIADCHLCDRMKGIRIPEQVQSHVQGMDSSRSCDPVIE